MGYARPHAHPEPWQRASHVSGPGCRAPDGFGFLPSTDEKIACVTAWITASISVLVAVGAALLAHRNAMQLHQRQGQLARVNAQLEELYGPLLALGTANNAAWAAFRSVFRPDSHYAVSGQDLTEDERSTWLRWMKIVFMPNNRRAYEIIVSRAHLLTGSDVPRCLLDFCGHVAGYEVVVAQWEQGNYSQLTSYIAYPGNAYLDYIAESFAQLKRQQQELLALVHAR
jgi:hypothetical protein